MRSAGNFHPEWGYLAPAPSFMRTARIVLVATAIGASAGAVVVVSLVDRPGSASDNTSIAAHALVTSAPVIITSPASAETDAPTPARAAASSTQPAEAEAVASPQLSAHSASAAIAPPAQVTSPPATRAEAAAPASAPTAGAIAATSQPGPAAVQPNAIASAETSPASAAAAPAGSEPEGVAASDEAKKLAGKRHHPTNYVAARRWQYANDSRKRWRNERGFGPLMRLFSFRGSSSYAN